MPRSHCRSPPLILHQSNWRQLIPEGKTTEVKGSSGTPQKLKLALREKGTGMSELAHARNFGRLWENTSDAF